jgi:hypothetical protein
MRQRLRHGSVNGEDRIEPMGEMDTLSLGDKAEKTAIPIEAPGPPFLDDL